jgi:hypothetical protein
MGEKAQQVSSPGHALDATDRITDKRYRDMPDRAKPSVT